MRRIVLPFIAVMFLLAGPAMARQVPIDGTHSKDEIKRICAEQGGEFGANLNGYWCSKACTGGNCLVFCERNGQCTGNVPKSGLSSIKPGKASPKTFLRSLK